MRHRSDPAKREQWAKRFERFEKSGQTVAEFCRDEGVSAASFYQWRQKLGSFGRKRKPGSRRRKGASAFQRLHVSPPDVSSGVRVRLPDGMVLELGSDLPTIERIVSQVLDHRAMGAG